jgi:hypothetical protein
MPNTAASEDAGSSLQLKIYTPKTLTGSNALRWSQVAIEPQIHIT